jgi:hypothetical protein
MHMDMVQIISIAVSVAIMIVVIELIRRNHLKERYSLIWLVTSQVLLLFSVWRKLLDTIASSFGIYYAPSFLFLLAIFFLLVLLLHFSTVISSLSDNNKRLAQEIGVLRKRVERIENIAEAAEGTRR